MRELYFTVDADLLELVDSIGHEYEEINDNLKIKVDLDYEREQYGLDIDVISTQYDMSDEMLSNIFLGPELTEALIYTERVY